MSLICITVLSIYLQHVAKYACINTILDFREGNNIFERNTKCRGNATYRPKPSIDTDIHCYNEFKYNL